jgi:hypothetical protein
MQISDSRRYESERTVPSEADCDGRLAVRLRIS